MVAPIARRYIGRRGADTRNATLLQMLATDPSQRSTNRSTRDRTHATHHDAQSKVIARHEHADRRAKCHDEQECQRLAGLGMAICQEIVLAHGWILSAYRADPGLRAVVSRSAAHSSQ